MRSFLIAVEEKFIVAWKIYWYQRCEPSPMLDNIQRRKFLRFSAPPDYPLFRALQNNLNGKHLKISTMPKNAWISLWPNNSRNCTKVEYRNYQMDGKRLLNKMDNHWLNFDSKNLRNFCNRPTQCTVYSAQIFMNINERISGLLAFFTNENCKLNEWVELIYI